MPVSRARFAPGLPTFAVALALACSGNLEHPPPVNGSDTDAGESGTQVVGGPSSAGPGSTPDARASGGNDATAGAITGTFGGRDGGLGGATGFGGTLGLGGVSAASAGLPSASGGGP